MKFKSIGSYPIRVYLFALILSCSAVIIRYSPDMTTRVHSISIAATATSIKKGLPAGRGTAAGSKTIKSFFISASASASQSSSESVDGVACSKRSNPHPPLVDDATIGSSIDTCNGSSLKRSRQGNDSTAPSSAARVTSDAPSQWRPFDQLESGWRAELSDETSKPYFRSLLGFLDAELRAGRTIYPPAEHVFTAFNLCPLDQVKVVVIGQDPYHGPGQAHGLAFSVGLGVAAPPSLKNIILEAKNDPVLKSQGKGLLSQGSGSPQHGCLECWARQGVLLLNSVLTVRAGEPNSHQKKGWEDFTDAVVRVLNKKGNLVYLLWGNPAQNKCKSIQAGNNVLIKSSHPSPLGAYKTSEPFMGSRCFSRCNEALLRYGKEPVSWDII